MRCRPSPCVLVATALVWAAQVVAQVSTPGFLNQARPEAPGTLLSHPVANGSEPIGRTTSINYVNGWIIVGGEAPGSRSGSDLVMRVYDISDPANPIRRYPSDFGLNYPNNRWYQGNVGWNAHGTAQSGALLLPDVVRVASHGGPVELGGTNGIPTLPQLPLWYNRSSQAGPWSATHLWYGTPDQDVIVSRARLNQWGYVELEDLATIDHVGAYGGGDWHPIFFGDLLIYARSGSAARDGVVVYRLQYDDFDDPAQRSITPHYVGSLDGGFQGYWPNLFSDGTGLYVVGSTTDILIAADLTQAADPSGDGSVRVAASLTIPGFNNATYPVYQDHFGFIQNRKIDMTRFLAGDAQPVVLTLDEFGNAVDTTQMSLALGNLWLTGGYPLSGRSQGMGVWVHQQAPDTTPPRVSFHIPQSNRTNYPRHAPLSFLLHEHPRFGGPRNGIDFTVRPVLADDSLGAPVDGFLIHDFAGVLTFTPDGGLAADTTYQVDFLSDPAQQIGFFDAAGNAIEPYAFRFSTGGGLQATEPPVIQSVAADVYQPAPGATVTVSVDAGGSGPLAYRFNFAGTWSDWGPQDSASHIYPSSGRQRVIVQVRDIDGNVSTDSLRLLVITPPAAGPRPTASGPLVVGDDPAGWRLWVVNPDADTVAVLDAASGAKLAEHAVGSNPRSIARDALGRYWVTCHRSDEIRILLPDGSLFATVPLAYGAAPFGVAASPDGQTMFVSLYGSGQVARFSASAPLAAPTMRSVFPTARALAVSADGQRVFVTRFLSTELEGEVAELAGTSVGLTLTRTFRLSSSNAIDGGDRAAGVPNYLAAIAIAPDGSRAAVASKQDNIQRGTLFGVGDLTHETSVRAVVSFLDLNSNAEIRHSRRDFDNSDSPSALAYTPLGDTLLVALQGNQRVVGIDTLGIGAVLTDNTPGATVTTPAVLQFEVGTGLAPQGIVVDGVSGRLFTQDFMGRSVTVRDAAPFLDENRTSLPVVATTDTVAADPLADDVLLGKQIFYNAADPRMSADSYISCASCHVDGGHDGRVWDFTGRGEGLRRTTDLRGRSGTGHGNVHWSGNFDEIQDFEHDIRGPFGGLGFLDLSPQDFATLHPSPASGKAGLSPALDALAAYVASLGPDHTPRSPSRGAGGVLSDAAVRGRDVFVAEQCGTCHAGDRTTNSSRNPVAQQPLFEVGTISQLSGRRLGGSLLGIDTPTLHGLAATRVYLHHGQAETLADVFGYAGGTLHLAAEAELLTTVSPAAVSVWTDSASQGGGGFLRGAYGGTAVSIGNESGAATPPGVRFAGVDGGAGGAARVSLRYVRQYNNGTALLRVNGVQQTLNVLRQYPDNSWMTSGWRWITVDTTLLPGPTNTIEVLRGNGDLQLNAMLVANADDLAAAAPHRRVMSLSTNQRADLLSYVAQLDGRDAAGQPLPAPPAPAPVAPSIVRDPAPVRLAAGNRLELSVVVGGSGPFQYQWYRDGIAVGGDDPLLVIEAVEVTDGGSYWVHVTSGHGSATSGTAAVDVQPALAVETTSLPGAVVGTPYAVQLDASGGIDARQWSLGSGALPVGLSLSAEGILSGTPVAPARASVVVRVADSSGSAQRTLALEVAPVGGFVADPDLVLHYTFDEGSGTRVWDAAAGGNDHSTDVADAHWIPDGRFGGAYGPGDRASAINDFSPVNQTDLDFLPRGEPFTFSVWVRTSATSGYNTVFGKDRGDAPWDVQYRLWMINHPGSLQGINGNQYGGSLSLGARPLNDGQWHLLTLVNYLDGATWRTRVYYDEGSTWAQFNTGAGGRLPGLLRIGDTSRGGNTWVGQLDDLRIYRRALSVSEIASLYAPPPTATPTASATATPSPVVTVTATATPTSVSTATATPSATATATVAPPATCPAQPLVGCERPLVPGAGELRIDDYPGTRDRGDRVEWQWRQGEPMTPADFADPSVDATYRFCVYDGSGRRIVALSLPPGPPWRRRGELVWSYKDAQLLRGGVRQLSLRAGASEGEVVMSDRRTLSLKARGKRLNLASTGGGNLPEMPEFPLPLGSDGVRAQLSHDGGRCWETLHSSEVSRNFADGVGVRRFRARSD